jgi:hypothetical protein
LSLTPEQKGKAYPIVREHFENIDKIRGDVRDQIQKEIEGMNEELLVVFDENQKLHWQDNIQRMGERFPGIGRRRGGPGGPGQRGAGQRGPGSGQRRQGSGQRGLMPGQPGLVPGQPGLIPDQNPWLTMPGIGDSNSPGMDMGGFRRDGRRRQRPTIDPNMFPPTMPFNTNPFTPPIQE